LITLIEDNLGYALHQKVEALKIDLSASQTARFEFRSYPIHIALDVAKPDFEEILAPIVSAVSAAAAETLKRAGLDPAKLDAVYFTGGTSQVPALRKGILSLAPQARVAEQDTFTSVAAGLVSG